MKISFAGQPLLQVVAGDSMDKMEGEAVFRPYPMNRLERGDG
ncbi:MAG: hypothetical protein ACD_75C01821G0002, partial [uncultured bacterium]